MSAVPLVKCINGHTGCAATERYLERDGRAIGHNFVNLNCMERGGEAVGWAAEMDELQALYGNGEPYRGKPAITYRHYIVSPDPADKIDLDRLRELTVAWAQKHFGDYQVAIVYHDDNEHRIPHAHIIVNSTNVETGRRLHVPQPKELNRDLQQMARERGLGYLADEHHLYDKKAKGGSRRTAQREYKGRAERRIEREGGYSWVADIRERARTARALSTDEASYRELLGVLGVELSLNSPNARRRDYLYALADHPSRKVGGEKLGWPYGKGALEHEWLMLSPFREEKLREVAWRSRGGSPILKALTMRLKSSRRSGMPGGSRPTTAYCLPRSPNPCGTSGAIAALVPPDGATARDHEAAPGPKTAAGTIMLDKGNPSTRTGIPSNKQTNPIRTPGWPTLFSSLCCTAFRFLERPT